MYELTRPSEVARCDFLAAAACPFFRRMLMACSMSPLDSSKASRHAVNPAPVRSRNSLTSCAEMFEFPGVAMSILFLLNKCGQSAYGSAAPTDYRAAQATGGHYCLCGVSATESSSPAVAAFASTAVSA